MHLSLSFAAPNGISVYKHLCIHIYIYGRPSDVTTFGSTSIQAVVLEMIQQLDIYNGLAAMPATHNPWVGHLVGS